MFGSEPGAAYVLSAVIAVLAFLSFAGGLYGPSPEQRPDHRGVPRKRPALVAAGGTGLGAAEGAEARKTLGSVSDEVMLTGKGPMLVFRHGESTERADRGLLPEGWGTHGFAWSAQVWLRPPDGR